MTIFVSSGMLSKSRSYRTSCESWTGKRSCTSIRYAANTSCTSGPSRKSCAYAKVPAASDRTATRTPSHMGFLTTRHPPSPHRSIARLDRGTWVPCSTFRLAPRVDLGRVNSWFRMAWMRGRLKMHRFRCHGEMGSGGGGGTLFALLFLLFSFDDLETAIMYSFHSCVLLEAYTVGFWAFHVHEMLPGFGIELINVTDVV